MDLVYVYALWFGWGCVIGGVGWERSNGENPDVAYILTGHTVLSPHQSGPVICVYYMYIYIILFTYVSQRTS